MTMAYIVTTTKTVQHDVVRGGPSTVILSRRAVATLTDAQEAVYDVVASEQYRANDGIAALTLPESGGTVGPLPDGTLIEIERITYARLANRAGFDANAYRGDTAQACLAIIDAYNAREADAR